MLAKLIKLVAGSLDIVLSFSDESVTEDVYQPGESPIVTGEAFKWNAFSNVDV